MFVVAITRLGTALEDEAKALAAELGSVAYEQRLKLNAGLPAIVLSTTDGDRARRQCDALRARGHDALCCTRADVAAPDDRIDLRSFRFDDDALVATDDASGRLRWDDVAVLVRAAYRTGVQLTGAANQKKFAPGRAVLTGGLLLSKTTKNPLSSHHADDEGVLFVFPRRGGAPWLVRELRVRYDALGAAAGPSSLKNFELVLARIRELAPHAAFDDRLLRRKVGPADIDLLAHLIATELMAGDAPPR